MLLTTYGRKSGKKYVRPVGYFMDGDNYSLMAAYGGGDKHPGSYWNAAKNNRPVEIEIKGKTMTVDVIDAQGEDYERCYKI